MIFTEMMLYVIIFLDRNIRDYQKKEEEKMNETTFTTGYNYEVVKSALEKLQAAYVELHTHICTNFQNDFMTPLGDCMASETGHDMFGKVILNQMGLNKSVNNTFKSILETVTTSANNWARQTGGTLVTNPFAEQAYTDLANTVQTNINGDRGANTAKVRALVPKLSLMKSNASIAISNAKSAVNSSGFIGAGEQGAIVASLNTIGGQIAEQVDKIATDTNTALDDTISQYGEIESTNTDNLTAKESA